MIELSLIVGVAMAAVILLQLIAGFRKDRQIALWKHKCQRAERTNEDMQVRIEMLSIKVSHMRAALRERG